MKLIAWNCRGLGKPRAVRELTELVRVYQPKVIGLMETKIDKIRLDFIRCKLGYTHGFVVDRIGIGGGIALWWKDDVDIHINSYSRHHIDALVKNPNYSRITLFYGSPFKHLRHKSWDLLNRLASSSNHPWIIFGDFNDVCFSWEVMGGRVKGEWQMSAFRKVLRDNNLFDLGFRGNPFTFSNRRMGSQEYRARLDRVYANGSWRNNYPLATVDHVATCTSDHYLLLIDFLGHQTARKVRQYKFEPMWLRDKNFVENFSTFWPSDSMQGVPFRHKLNKCANNIKGWNQSQFGSVQGHLKRLRGDLEKVKKRPRDNDTVLEECRIINDIDEWRLREELLWKQRSRVDWLREGDKNTKFFHAKATHRRKINSVQKIQTENGEWITDRNGIIKTVLDHIKGIFVSSRGNFALNLTEDMTHMSIRLSEGSILKLTEPFSLLEVREALFQMHPTKAPGPDGFSAIFYQKFWGSVGTDVTRMVLHILNEGKIEDGINDTIISLIPKMKGACKVEDFRPISLCNVTSKLITKILANRLKVVLPEVISEFQGAFVQGRLITDNFLLAYEIDHFIKSGKGGNSGFLSLKTDMSKAYDRMEWDFLEAVQLKMGFPAHWVKLVMECVTSVKYQVKFQDRLSESFLPARGLRQGDPLSPYLFIMCAEWLSKSVSANVEAHNLDGIKMGRGAPDISHLFFADDSIFFTRATFHNVVVLKGILDKYQALSGQRINLQKSEVVYSRKVPLLAADYFTDILKVRKVDCHSKYLGLPMGGGRNKNDLFKFLIERISNRVSGWNSMLLSAAGKEVLIKSILQSLPQYVMMVFKLPTSLCKRLSSIISNYWWSYNGGKAIHWGSKFLLSRAKELGGMNFRDFELMNDAFLLKQFWRLLENPHSLVSRCLKVKYFLNSTIFEAPLRTTSSYVWNAIWKVGMQARNLFLFNDDNSVVWKGERNGLFSIKSAYGCLKEIKDAAVITRIGEPSNSAHTILFWKKIWRSNVQEKVKIFVWRAFHNLLPVASNLRLRGCEIYDQCWFCHLPNENAEHVFLRCWWATAFWNMLDCQYLISDVSNGDVADWLWFWVPKLSINQLSLVLYGMSMIWFCRNELAHEKECMDATTAAVTTKHRVENFFNPSFKFCVVADLGSLVWEKPVHPYLKINTDGSWFNCLEKSGYGCVARDSDGFIVGVRAGSHDQISSVLDAEGISLSKAMLWAENSDWHFCIFEIDCSELFSLLQSGSRAPFLLKDWFRTCSSLLLNNSNWRLSLVRREANQQADSLAHKASAGWSWSCNDSIPFIC